MVYLKKKLSLGRASFTIVVVDLFYRELKTCNVYSVFSVDFAKSKAGKSSSINLTFLFVKLGVVW